MIVVISQPRYLPFLGYLHRIAVSDLFVYLDHVQYTARDWENRNKVKTSQNWTWLTVPVNAPYRARIPEITINNETNWGVKHWKTIQNNYGRAPYFQQYAPSYEKLLVDQIWTHLTPLNVALTEQLCQDMRIRLPRFVYSSEMNLHTQGSDLILDICQQLNASIYLSGPLGKDYLDETEFKKNNIRIVYHDYQHPTYPQLYGEFQPYMAAIDLLFNTGPDSLNILMQNQELIIP